MPPPPPPPRLPPLRVCGHRAGAEDTNTAFPVACEGRGKGGGGKGKWAPTIRASARRLSAPLRLAARFAHPCTNDVRGDSQHFKFKRRRRMPCQCSSAWLEHSPCKRKVVGSDPIIGSLMQKRTRPAGLRSIVVRPCLRLPSSRAVVSARPPGAQCASARRDPPHGAARCVQPAYI